MRQLKPEVEKQLRRVDFEAGLSVVSTYPARRVINSLISFYCHRDPLVRWRAVEATGRIVSRHAENDMESARVIMRRFLWMLNDESGGIGWGVPEAMGEILSLSDGLCDEYHRIFLSYIQPACNFLEHPVLQRGLLWGIGRLAPKRSDVIRPMLPDIALFLSSEDPYHRAFAARIIGLAGHAVSYPMIEELSDDHAEIEIYEDSTVKTKTVAAISQSF